MHGPQRGHPLDSRDITRHHRAMAGTMHFICTCALHSTLMAQESAGNFFDLQLGCYPCTELSRLLACMSRGDAMPTSKRAIRLVLQADVGRGGCSGLLRQLSGPARIHGCQIRRGQLACAASQTHQGGSDHSRSVTLPRDP